MSNDTFICYICGTSDVVHLFDKPAENYLGIKESFRIVQCCQCGMVSVANQPPLRTLETLYDKTFFSTSQQKVMSETVIKNAESRVALLQTYHKSGRLLDVGCGQGNFLSVARHTYQCKGIDVSEFAISQGKQQWGLDLQHNDFLELDLGQSKFDVITMWDFIAHVPSPLDYLSKARQLLERDGILVLTTGDIGSLSAKIMHKHWHLMIPPKHLHYFSRSTMDLALQKSGFEEPTLFWPGKTVPFEFMMTKFARIINWEWLEKQTWPSFLPQHMYINLADIMMVVTKARHS